MLRQKHGLSLLFGLILFTSLVLPAEPQTVPTQTLRQFGRAHGFPNLKVHGKRIVVSCRFHNFEFEGNTRRVLYNGTAIWLNYPLTQVRGEWALARVDIDKTLLPLVFPHRWLAVAGTQTIVLDAGHGGNDKGAVSPRQVEEKRVNLYLARQVRDILRRRGITVRMTRDTDTYLSLDQRCKLAERWDADLFVSIHMNSATSRTAQGIETHVLPPAGCPITAGSKIEARDRIAYANNRFDAANAFLGYALQRHMLRTTSAGDRGVRRSRLYVTRNSACPAALVEGGFLSHPGEEDKITRKAYRDQLARGIADGIIEYLEAVRRAHSMIK